ncbi:MAG TPA: TetR family transcriptional regulator [Beijerinckiaceae bacterium]|nr:TetR family transcriptional regulator [Beijerinckiaceae bacterium]
MSTESVEARILAAAQTRLRREGLRRLTVVRIAEDAGMTHANVYRFFKSKADLVDRLISDWLRDLERRLTDITQAPDPAHDKLERFLTLVSRNYADKARSDPRLFDALIDALDQQRPAALRHRQRQRDLLLQVVEEGIATRLFAGSDPRRLRQTISDLMHRFIDPHALRTAASIEPASFDARRERATRAVLRTLAAARI